MMASTLPLDGLYQLGFTTRDLRAAAALLGKRYGIERFRWKRNNDWMETAHAWAGETMIEVIGIGEGAPPLYADHMPEADGLIRLHHLGRRIADVAGWDRLQAAIAANALDTPLIGSTMEGHLRYVYVDTRQDFGVYSEYVCLTGPALSIYDDIP